MRAIDIYIYTKMDKCVMMCVYMNASAYLHVCCMPVCVYADMYACTRAVEVVYAYITKTALRKMLGHGMGWQVDIGRTAAHHANPTLQQPDVGNFIFLKLTIAMSESWVVRMSTCWLFPCLQHTSALQHSPPSSIFATPNPQEKKDKAVVAAA